MFFSSSTISLHTGLCTTVAYFLMLHDVFHPHSKCLAELVIKGTLVLSQDQ